MKHRPNIILCVADALRADVLSCYGCKKGLSPHIDSLAQDGCQFDHAISVSPVTPVIFTSLFTGMFPFQHGIKEFTYALQSDTATLAQTLKKQGYRTGAITASVVLDRSRRFSLGFDSYNDNFTHVCLDTDRDLSSIKKHSVIFRTAELNARVALDWLEQNKHETFFLFLHLWDTHVPFIPPRKYLSSSMKQYAGRINGSTQIIEKINAGDVTISATDRDYIRGLYESSVCAIDGAVGTVVEFLKGNGLYNDTIILFTADHGSGLGEHHMVGNGRLLYEEDIRVPLIITCGEIYKPKKKVIPSLVSSVDIMPTLLELVGCDESLDSIAGMTLMPLMENLTNTVREATYAETLLPMRFENKRIALRTEEWKYIREPFERVDNYQVSGAMNNFKTFWHRVWHMKGHRFQTIKQALDRLIFKRRVKMHQRIDRQIMNTRPGLRELYNLKRDPVEKHNMIEKERERAQHMDELLAQWIQGKTETSIGMGTRDIDERLIEKLQQLGYM